MRWIVMAGVVVAAGCSAGGSGSRMTSADEPMPIAGMSGGAPLVAGFEGFVEHECSCESAEGGTGSAIVCAHMNYETDPLYAWPQDVAAQYPDPICQRHTVFIECVATDRACAP